MFSATKIRLYPTEDQCQKLAQSFGCARWAYNEALRIKSTAYKERHESISCFSIKSMLPEWKKQHPWLKDTHSQVLQSSILNLDDAYKKWFQNSRDRKAGKTKRFVGYPQFKKRHGRQSIQYPQGVKVNGDLIYLPKIGWVKAVIHREPVDIIKTVTVSRTPSGKYYASILQETATPEPKPMRHLDRDKVIGLDMGLTHVGILSDGRKINNPRFLKAAASNVRRKQKALSRKKKGSANRTKARHHVASAHERLAATRNTFQHTLSKRLVDENQAIIVETLKVQNMLKNRRLAKHISDAAWSMLINKLTYKAKWSGKHLIKLDQWFASSKTCSQCHHKVDVLPLDVRLWTCPACDTLLDRDINAAINLREQGIVQLKADGLSVSDCGRLGKTFTPKAPADEAVTSWGDPRSTVLQGGE